MSDKLLVDAVTNIALVNGVVRLDCQTVGGDGKFAPSCQLYIPASRIGPFMQRVAEALQEISRKQKERAEAQAAGEAPEGGDEGGGLPADFTLDFDKK